MLKLLLGRAGTGKTTEILGTMAREGERRPQLLIVPEQHSHDAERQLCAVGGNGVSLCAEVLSFTRLASRVFSVAGGLAEPVLDAGGRLLLMDVARKAGEDRLGLFSGDGVVVATPTGSTGYSLSAGGPIVEPTARNFVISPICAHSVFTKSFVLSASGTVTVAPAELNRKQVYLSVDGGKAFALRQGDQVRIGRSRYETELLRLTDKSIYDILRTKMTGGIGYEK